MGAYRGMAAKCPTEGFRESLVRFRADRPPITSVGRILSPFLAKAALARKQHHLFGPRQSAHWASSCNLVSSNLTPPRGARAEFVAPHVTHGRKRPQSVAGASPVRQFDLTSTRSGTSAGDILGSPRGTRWPSRAGDLGFPNDPSAQRHRGIAPKNIATFDTHTEAPEPHGRCCFGPLRCLSSNVWVEQ